MNDEHSSSSSSSSSEGEQPEVDAVVSEEPIEPDGTPPSPRSTNVPIIVGVVVAVVAVAAIVGSAFAVHTAQELDATFQATDTVPYSLQYPEGWAKQDSGGLVVLSPLSDIAELTPERLTRLLEEEPESVLAMQLVGVGADQDFLPVIRQQGLRVAADEPVVIDGYEARRIVQEGKLFQSGPGQGPQNQGTFTAWLVDLGDDRATLFGFVNTEEAEDPRLFDAIAASVTFDDVKLEAALDQFGQAAAPGATEPAPAPSASP